MLAVIDKIGPIIVSLNAESLVDYIEGIIDFDKCSQVINHNALAVGYGTENDVDYYIIKNSWGPDWGIKKSNIIYNIELL